MIGCIADDFTGATDIAGTFVERGHRTMLQLGLSTAEHPPASPDAIVVALKSRTQWVDGAVSDSRHALSWLRAAGCERFVLKYCSTFDSTATGNIGPVAEALLEDLGGDQTIFAPTYPAMGRTVYAGHLFVGHALLSETGMRDHPLTPMRDSNIVRVLAQQSRPKTALVDLTVVRRGVDAVRERLDQLRRSGVAFVVTDAVTMEDLRTIVAATEHFPLITGGAALAACLEPPKRRTEHEDFPCATGPRVVLAGSRSTATRDQVQHAARVGVSVRLDPGRVARDYVGAVADAIARARAGLGAAPVVVYAGADDGRRPDPGASSLIEAALAEIACELHRGGVRRFIIAGGETAGAVVSALGFTRLRVGEPVEPGLPWTSAGPSADPTNLLLKSGNFGSRQLFETAWGAA